MKCKLQPKIFFTFCLASVCGLLALYGCKKNEEKDIIQVADEVKEYLVFKPGSFWVYRDTVTGNLDTVTLIRASSFVKNSPGTPVNFEEIAIEYDGTLSGNKDYTVRALTQGKSVYFEDKSQTYRFHNEFNVGKKLPEFDGANFRGFASETDSVAGPLARFRDDVAFNTLDTAKKILVYQAYKKGLGLVTREYSNGSYEELIEWELK